MWQGDVVSVAWISRSAPTPGARPDDCFADETAIDFPSVGHIVARVKDSFVGDHDPEGGRTLTGEVAVSRRDAIFGTTVSRVYFACRSVELLE